MIDFLILQLILKCKNYQLWNVIETLSILIIRAKIVVVVKMYPLRLFFIILFN